jgi:osmoprotectant transport system substrate-binding protein
VGSKLDLEGQLLGEMIILPLRNRGFEIVDNTAFGATSVVRKALESGELDIYPSIPATAPSSLTRRVTPSGKTWRRAGSG